MYVELAIWPLSLAIATVLTHIATVLTHINLICVVVSAAWRTGPSITRGSRILRHRGRRHEYGVELHSVVATIRCSRRRWHRGREHGAS